MNEWNKLSTDCVHASSGNMFQNSSTRHLCHQGGLNIGKGFVVHYHFTVGVGSVLLGWQSC